MEIRTARPSDAEGIRAIYAPYVEDTAITFELEIPDTSEFEKRIEKTLKEYPYIVAVSDGKIAGYAYAGAFRPRAAYKHCVEMSVYVDRTHTGKGVGKLLYNKLEEILSRQNIFVLYACITMTERINDANLTDASIGFHTKMGYNTVGCFHHCGYKFGKWYSMIWMEKNIKERPADPEAFIPFESGIINI